MKSVLFYVIADGIKIRVYGTSFNVNTHDKERVQTALVEGSIGLSAERGAGIPDETFTTGRIQANGCIRERENGRY